MKRNVLMIVFLLILTVSCVLGYFTITESGLRYIFSKMVTFVPGKLSAIELKGRLIGPIKISGLQYRSSELTVNLDSFYLEWRILKLLSKNLHSHDVLDS